MSDKNETQLPTEGGSTPRACSPSSDADRACYCFDRLALECKLNPTAYHREGIEIVRNMEREINRLRTLLEKAIKNLPHATGCPSAMRPNDCNCGYMGILYEVEKFHAENDQGHAAAGSGSKTN